MSEASRSARWSKVGGWISTRVRRTTVLLASMALLAPAAAQAQQLSPAWGISTIAGNGTNADSGDNGPASSAKVAKPVGVARDRAGNVYIAETTSVIRKISPSGVITTIAGTSGKAGYSGDGGPATAALLNSPYGVEIDRDGNLLIGEIVNHVIRKINLTTGIISTVAGTGTKGYLGDGGSAATAQLNTPYTAAGDNFGNVYICDAGNHVIRKVDKNGVITTFAGTGSAGNTGDGGPAANATLGSPYSIWNDPAGNLYINDVTYNVVRVIDTKGIIRTIAGNGTKGYSGDGGPATSAMLNTQHGTVIDGFGNVYIADETSDIMRMIDPTGIITTIGGTPSVPGFAGDGGPALSAKTNLPYGLAIDEKNVLYFPDVSNYRIRRMSLNLNLPDTQAGASTTQKLFLRSPVAFTPATATLSPSNQFTVGTLSGCTLGTQLAANTICTVPVTFTPTAPGIQTAQLTVAEVSGKLSVLGLSAQGIAPEVLFGPATLTTIAGTGTAGNSGATGAASAAQVSAPRGGAVDSAGNIFFADSGNNSIRRIDAQTGIISTVAGAGSAGYSGDGGPAKAALLNAPATVALDPAGDLYIADTGNSVIRFVDASTGNISTIAGNGTAAYTGDAGAATSASLNRPQGLALDLGGHVFVADTGNNVIRYFGKGGDISTWVGTGTSGYTGDGGNMHDATLNAPRAVAFDLSNNLYIVDSGNSVIRMVSARNQITTIAGKQGQSSNTGDGGPATTATLATPTDVAVDAAGDLYIAAGGRIRLIDENGTISTVAGTGASGSYSGEGGAASNAVIPSPANNVMLDSSANLYIAATAANRLLKVAQTAPRNVDLGIQAPNTTGSAQRISVMNAGNSTLQMSGVAVSANFGLQTTDPTSCSATTALAPGTSCSLNVVFSPTTTGNFTGTITLTDNALNVAGSTQTINLTGKGLLINTTTTVLTLAPTSPVYGQTTAAVATATITGGAAATGNVVFTLNGVSIGTVALTGNTATIHLPSLQAGPITLAASYSGDANNSSSSSSVAVTVQPAVLTVTVANATKFATDPNPTFTYTITGLVNGDTSGIITGTPAITSTATQASPAGNYPITASVGTLVAPNYIFNFVPGTLNVQPTPPPNFILSVTPANVVMQSSGSATYTVSLKSTYGYTGTATLSCAPAANLGCSFVPAKLTGDPTTTVTSQLTVYAGSVYSSVRNEASKVFFALPLLPLAFLMRKRRRKLASIMLAMLLLAALNGITGCGTGTNTLPSVGTTTITVIATDSASNLSHSTTLTVTVK